MGIGALAMNGLLLLSFLVLAAGPQSTNYPVRETETIRRTLEFSGSANHMLELDNVFGSIHVGSAAGRAVEMTADRTIRAESQDRILDAKRDVKMDITDNAETIRIYVDGP